MKSKFIDFMLSAFFPNQCPYCKKTINFNMTECQECFERMPAKFECNCSRERVEKALIALGRQELANIIADGKPETLNCSFCNTDYTFSVDEMKEILKKCDH